KPAGEPALVPAARESAPPLSLAQQRLWFLDQLTPGTATYNIPAAVRLTGALDVGALERSLGEIIQRHEALRTTFSGDSGQPAQWIASRGCVRLVTTDLSSLPEADREARARRLSDQEAQRPFDLARGPLTRMALLRLRADVH